MDDVQRMARGAKSSDTVFAVHEVVMHDTFIAKFNSSQCPGDDRQFGGPLVSTVKANVYDPVVDTDTGLSHGFFADNVALTGAV